MPTGATLVSLSHWWPRSVGAWRGRPRAETFGAGGLRGSAWGWWWGTSERANGKGADLHLRGGGAL